VLVTLLPFITGMSGLIYLATALVLNGFFLYYALVMKFTDRARTADARVQVLDPVPDVAVRRAAGGSLRTDNTGPGAVGSSLALKGTLTAIVLNRPSMTRTFPVSCTPSRVSSCIAFHRSVCSSVR
jgi:hypothetical protein